MVGVIPTHRKSADASTQQHSTHHVGEHAELGHGRTLDIVFDLTGLIGQDKYVGTFSLPELVLMWRRNVQSDGLYQPSQEHSHCHGRCQHCPSLLQLFKSI